ncbi:class I SAM-dependent methyltransferase [Nucisporomicrobium flavum]|jgi:SAM-dependent methyltransferase|uniref:class I SAM-dependent methyltransferase n=1 Tax=Nucisporomicrobium flavum TaxID=2785915 RepID=UPI0018F5EC24|nr:class I SAM-dependent methyltransferase [Nucisporomicrobium flavum]
MFSTAALDQSLTAARRAAWDAVMGSFVPGMTALEEVVHAAAEALGGGPPRRVLDLGGGPGVLAERMARRWPSAAVSLLDLDPVLLALARSALPGRVSVLDGDLASAGWTALAGGGHDLITVVMTLHYLPAERARAVYAHARRCLAPGGVLIVADLMPDDGLPSLMRALDPGAGEAAAELAWAQWWNGIAEADDLRSLVRSRAVVLRDRAPAEFTASAAWHAAAAGAAGFAEAGVIWRCGRHAALAAVAGPGPAHIVTSALDDGY